MSTEIPLDIQLLIIERLPIKSLLRFRSVCKAWNSFISSSRFIAAFRNDAHSQQQLIVSCRDEEKYVSVFDNHDHQSMVDLSVPPLVQGTRLLDSSHGLLCMVDSFSLISQTYNVLLWNPAIRRSVAVSVPYVVDHQQFRSIVAFGVCPLTMDPTLVKITFLRDPSKIETISCFPFQVMLFTLSSGQWRCLSNNHLPRKSIKFFNGYETVVGRFIYLVGLDCSAFDGEGRTLIMSFDLTSHEFREVDIPNSLHRSYNMNVSRLRESLIVLDIGQHSNNKKFHVWMMDDSKAFTKLFTINPPNAYVSQTLGFSERGEPIIEWRNDEMDGSSSAVGVYEPGLGDIKDLGIRGNKDSFYVTFYTESLLLLDHEDGRTIRC